MNKKVSTFIASTLLIFVGIVFVVYFLTPRSFAFSDSCSEHGYTVVYINGILTSEKEAKDDARELGYEYQKKENGDVEFIVGYNESHFGGIGDLVKSAQQAYGQSENLDFDLTNILNQIHGELSTRKVLLVGHSQGTFYTNLAYNYLTKNGIPAESIAVYNVATPADGVAGQGNYLTSSTDKVINQLVRDLTELGSAKQPLPANIDLPLSDRELADPYGGHSFSRVYLAEAPVEIIGNVSSALNNLKSEPISYPEGSVKKEGCFVPPSLGVSYYAKKIGFGLGEGFYGIVSTGSKAVYRTGKNVGTGFAFFYNAVKNLFTNFSQYFVADVSSSVNNSDNIEQDNNQSQQNSNSETEQNNNENENSNSAIEEPVVISNNNGSSNTGEVLGVQDEADNLGGAGSSSNNTVEPVNETENNNETSNSSQTNNNSNESSQTSSPTEYGASSPDPIYDTILISEIQIVGEEDSKEEFVELYNPNDIDVDLTEWYLQRKTETGESYTSYASSTLFDGKTIKAKDYFVIAREGYFAASGDIFTSSSLTENNTLVLKSPSRAVIDMVGFGPTAQEFEANPADNPIDGKSIGRKISGDSLQDTNNNNVDFEANEPTVGGVNIAYENSDEGGGGSAAPEDNSPPEVEFDLAATQSATTFDVVFTVEDVGGSADPSGIAGYTLRYKEEGGSWQEKEYVEVEGSPITYEATVEFADADDETTYYFQAKAKDVLENESEWLPDEEAETMVRTSKTILINEIQSHGAEDKDDEFIELYNPNDIDVILDGFALKKKTSTGTESNLISSAAFEGTIPAEGFFLIVPQSNIGNLDYDATYSGASYSIAQENNTVLIYNHLDELLDKVGYQNSSLEEEDYIADYEGSPFTCTGEEDCIPQGKSIERKSLGLDKDNNANDFQVSAEPTPDGTFPKTTLNEPDYLTLEDTYGTPQFNRYHDILISWQSAADNIDFFQVQYKLNDGEWEDWLEETEDEEAEFKTPYSLLTDKSYAFRVRAQDTEGNLGDWSNEIEFELSSPVLLSEFAFFGTNAADEHQWLELYNRSSEAIDLTGWIIEINNGNSSTEIELAGSVAASSYFVLERGEDAIADYTADQIIDEDIKASSSVILRNAQGQYIDEINTSSLAESDYVIDDRHYSIERISYYSFGFSSDNWKINNGITKNGTDQDGDPIYGTPGQENSCHQIYTLLETFLESAFLDKDWGPFLFKGANEFLEDDTLEIEAGSVIKFYDTTSYLTINGTLLALASEGNEIIFTSFADDEQADSNQDEDGSAPAAGDWVGVKFSETSENSRLSNIFVRYAGAKLNNSTRWENAFWVEKSSIDLSNSTFEDNENRGLNLVVSNSEIDNVNFLGHAEGIFPRAIDIQGGSPTILNSYFEGNDHAIYIQYYTSGGEEFYATPTIENNNFIDNALPVYWGWKYSKPTFSLNTASGNGYDGIKIEDEFVESVTLGSGLAYQVPILNIVPEDVTLTLEAGVIMEFTNHTSGLQINGTLNAIGFDGSPIIFRPLNYADDNVAAGQWPGLRFTETSQNSELEYVEVHYAGSFYSNSNNKDFYAGIKVDQTDITLRNSLIKNNANAGVWLINSNSNIDNVQFIGHTVKKGNPAIGFNNARALFVEGATPEIEDSYFEEFIYGIYIDDWYDSDADETIVGDPELEDNSFEDPDNSTNIYYANSP